MSLPTIITDVFAISHQMEGFYFITESKINFNLIIYSVLLLIFLYSHSKSTNIYDHYSVIYRCQGSYIVYNKISNMENTG